MMKGALKVTTNMNTAKSLATGHAMNKTHKAKMRVIAASICMPSCCCCLFAINLVFNWTGKKCNDYDHHLVVYIDLQVTIQTLQIKAMQHTLSC